MALIKCPECGKELSDTVKFCPNCGYKLKGINRKFSQISKSTKKRFFVAAVCFVGVIVLIAILNKTLGLSDAENAQVISLNTQIKEVSGESFEGRLQLQLQSDKEKCQRIEAEYSKLNWKQRRKVDNYEIIKERIVAIDNKINSIRKQKIQNVINLINSIGEVDLESKSEIENAKNEYEKLDEEQKSQVTNFSQLGVLENKYNEVCVNETIKRINNIGSVSLENHSKEKIDDAEKLYDSLPQDIKNKVINYKILKKKNTEYNKLQDYKKLLDRVKKEMKDGCLNEAKGLLKRIPSKFKYKGTKVSSLKKQLLAKNAWVALCGRWKTTSGQMRVTQVWDYDGRSEYWYRDFAKGEEVISIKCRLLKGGKVKVVISGSLPVYTSYSSIQAGLEKGSVSLSKTKTMSSMGTIKTDSHTTLTLTSSGITANYYFVNPNEDQYFTYKYKSTMNFRKRIEKY